MSWSNTKVTDSGVELLKGVLSGRTLTIVEAVGGVGVVDSASLFEMTDVANRMQALKLRGMKDYDTHKKIFIQIGNENLAAGYTLNQIGVFARIDDEEPRMLFIMQDSKGVYIPSATENEDFLFEMHAAIAVSNDVNIKINVSSGIVVSVDFMLESIAAALQEHNEDENAHGNLSAAAEEAQATADRAVAKARDAMQVANEASSAAAQAVVEAAEMIDAHNADANSHADLRSDIDNVDARMILFELKYNTNVEGNSFMVDFDSLNELVVTGVWNEDLSRVEF